MAVKPISPLSPGPRKSAAGPASGGAGAYILDQFREFYDEVRALRDEALMSGRAGMSGFPDFDDVMELSAKPPKGKPPPFPGLGAPPPLPGDTLPEEAEEPEAGEDDDDLPDTGLKAEEALRRLQTLLEMQALEAGRRGGEYGVLYYREAQYVMAALADEIFLALDWRGRDYWRNDLLETRLFETYNAGDVFFKRLEKLLKTGDRVQAEIAIVYLLALTLGFRGRYAGGRDEGRIAEYRKQLYYYIYQKRPNLGDPSQRLSPEAYLHTQISTTARMLPSPARWLWLLAGAVVLYLIVAHFVFHDVLAPLIDALDRSGA